MVSVDARLKRQLAAVRETQALIVELETSIRDFDALQGDLLKGPDPAPPDPVPSQRKR